jgi:O-phosphoseryl-tRNA(Cys) synthetase
MILKIIKRINKMKEILINIEDNKIEEFVELLIKFKNEHCDMDEECIKIEGFRLEDFKKHFVIDSE